MFFVYAIKSINNNYIYVGLTSNLNRRLKEHFAGKEKTTRHYRHYTVLFTEICLDRVTARKREIYLKSGCGKEFLKSLIK